MNERAIYCWHAHTLLSSYFVIWLSYFLMAIKVKIPSQFLGITILLALMYKCVEVNEDLSRYYFLFLCPSRA